MHYNVCFQNNSRAQQKNFFEIHMTDTNDEISPIDSALKAHEGSIYSNNLNFVSSHTWFP